jgi:hypothetical protein
METYPLQRLNFSHIQIIKANVHFPYVTYLPYPISIAPFPILLADPLSLTAPSPMAVGPPRHGRRSSFLQYVSDLVSLPSRGRLLQELFLPCARLRWPNSPMMAFPCRCCSLAAMAVPPCSSPVTGPSPSHVMLVPCLLPHRPTSPATRKVSPSRQLPWPPSALAAVALVPAARRQPLSIFHRCRSACPRYIVCSSILLW